MALIAREKGNKCNYECFIHEFDDIQNINSKEKDFFRPFTKPDVPKLRKDVPLGTAVFQT